MKRSSSPPRKARPAAQPPRAYSPGLVAAVTYQTFAILIALGDITYLLRHYTRFPFGDHWAWLDGLYQHGLWATLFSQFNEHRLVIPGLWYFLDHRYFGSTNTLLVIVTVLIQIGCILLLIAPQWRPSGMPTPVRRVFMGFVVITMLWFIQAENFFYPFSLCLSCANLGMLASFYLFSRLCAGDSRRAVWLWVGVLASALWATFSYGHGMLVWPVLLAAGLWLRLPPRRLAAVFVVMLCALGVYFFHYKTPVQHANPLESLQRPIQVLQYAVLMIGLPFFPAGVRDAAVSSHFVSYAISVLGIMLAAVLLVRFAKTKPAERTREQVMYCSVLLFALGSGSITALGRSHFPLWQALSGRYAPVPLLFWISLAALITAYLSGAEVRFGAARPVWCALLILASLATLPTQARMGRYMANRERQQRAAALSVTVGVPDLARIAEEMSPRFDRILTVDRAATPFLGHSLFWRPEEAFLGTPLRDHFRLAPSADCMGFVDRVNLLPEPAQGARLLGWAWNARRGKAVDGIWIVGDQRIIRGLGITRIPRPDVAAAYSNGAIFSAGWIAYSRLPAQGSGALTVFASLDDGKSACPIGAPRVPAP